MKAPACVERGCWPAGFHRDFEHAGMVEDNCAYLAERDFRDIDGVIKENRPNSRGVVEGSG